MPSRVHSENSICATSRELVGAVAGLTAEESGQPVLVAAE